MCRLGFSGRLRGRVLLLPCVGGSVGVFCICPVWVAPRACVLPLSCVSAASARRTCGRFGMHIPSLRSLARPKLAVWARGSSYISGMGRYYKVEGAGKLGLNAWGVRRQHRICIGMRRKKIMPREWDRTREIIIKKIKAQKILPLTNMQ